MKKKQRSPEVVRPTVVLSWTLALKILLIVGAGLWIYSPVFHGDWNWDDESYLSKNPLMNDPAAFWKAWFQPGQFIEYYPIEQTVQLIQWQLWGNDTFGYHLTNLVLHIVNGLLVWRLLAKFRLRLAWLGGLIFVVHPMQVESVAWISELKNTLSLAPFLLCMCAWIDYAEHQKTRDYRLAIGWFLVAMLCKISMSPFPVVILFYAWWKRGRIDVRDLKESAPFFVISLALGAATILAGDWYRELNLDGSSALQVLGFSSRLALVGLSFSFYFTSCLWPMTPLPVYPKWSIGPPAPWQFFPWLVLFCVIFWLWRNRHGWGRHALLGLGFFFLLLGPFLGFHDISYMTFTWVMDHFLYIPIIGIVALVIAGLDQLDERLPASLRPYSLSLVLAILGFLAFESHSYAKVWTSQEALWSYTLKYNPDSAAAHSNLAYALDAKGQILEAGEQFQEALRLDPSGAIEQYNLGGALVDEGRVAEGIAHYEQAVKIDPDYADAWYNLGNALSQLGRNEEAMDSFKQVIRILPSFTLAHNNLGVVLAKMGRVSEGMQEFRASLKINPHDAMAHNDLGFALQQTGHIPEALEQYEQALQSDPNYAPAQSNLARLQGSNPTNN